MICLITDITVNLGIFLESTVNRIFLHKITITDRLQKDIEKQYLYQHWIYQILQLIN
jgi:hypothetical protein